MNVFFMGMTILICHHDHTINNVCCCTTARVLCLHLFCAGSLALLSPVSYAYKKYDGVVTVSLYPEGTDQPNIFGYLRYGCNIADNSVNH